MGEVSNLHSLCHIKVIIYFISILNLSHSISLCVYCSLNCKFLTFSAHFYFSTFLTFSSSYSVSAAMLTNLYLRGERGMLKKALSLDVVTACIVLSFSSPPPPQLHPFLGGGCGGSEEVCKFSWAPPPPMSGPPAELYLYVVGNLTNRRGVFCIFNT